MRIKRLAAMLAAKSRRIEELEGLMQNIALNVARYTEDGKTQEEFTLRVINDLVRAALGGTK